MLKASSFKFGTHIRRDSLGITRWNFTKRGSGHGQILAEICTNILVFILFYSFIFLIFILFSVCRSWQKQLGSWYLLTHRLSIEQLVFQTLGMLPVVSCTNTGQYICFVWA